MEGPSGFDDSMAAAKVHATTVALKYTVTICTLQSELDMEMAPIEPTPLFADAQAATDESHMERLTNWLAAKYAIVRWGMACGAIALGKVSSEGQAYRRHALLRIACWCTRLRPKSY